MSNLLWLEDVHVGDTFRTDVYHLTTDAIIEFASAWDPQPFHLGEESARDTFFKGLAASGWQTAAITMRLLVTTGLPLATGIIGASIELAWPPRPVPATSSTSSWKSPTCACRSRTQAADSSPPPTTPSINTVTSDSAPRLACWHSPSHTDPPSKALWSAHLPQMYW